MNTKHTKGPWIICLREDSNGIVGYIGPKSDTRIIVATSKARNTEQLANTQLIAAAPELLEACKVALNTCRDVLVAKQLAKIIAKAGGAYKSEGDR